MKVQVKAPAPAQGSLRPWRSQLLAAGALAWGSASAEAAAIEAAQRDELSARFACPPETSTRLRTLNDERTIPAALKHQAENATERLDRLGFLPDHPGLTPRAIVRILAATASLETDGVGGVGSQREIARRAGYSPRHVRTVHKYALRAELMDRFSRWTRLDRMPGGAAEPVTWDRRTLYFVHTAPRTMARGANDNFLLELAAAQDPPWRLQLPERRTSWEGIEIAVDEAEAEAADVDLAEESEVAPPPRPSAPQRPARDLPAALRDLPELLDLLAGVADGVSLDAIDIATLGTAPRPDGHGLSPEHLLWVIRELHNKIRDGKTVPSLKMPGMRWSLRGLRKRLASFMAKKAEDLQLQAKEAAHEAWKERDQDEWAERPAPRPEQGDVGRGGDVAPAGEVAANDTVNGATARPAQPEPRPLASGRPRTPTPPDLALHLIRSFERQLAACKDPARAAELTAELEDLRAGAGPPTTTATGA